MEKLERVQRAHENNFEKFKKTNFDSVVFIMGTPPPPNPPPPPHLFKRG